MILIYKKSILNPLTDRSSPSGGAGSNTPDTGGNLGLFSYPLGNSEEKVENGTNKKKHNKRHRRRSWI